MHLKTIIRKYLIMTEAQLCEALSESFIVNENFRFRLHHGYYITLFRDRGSPYFIRTKGKIKNIDLKNDIILDTMFKGIESTLHEEGSFDGITTDHRIYILEYRNGEKKLHFRARGKYTKSEVQKAFISYLNNDNCWLTDFPWRKKPWWKFWK